MCRCLVRFVLFSVNLIISLVGLALVGIGVAIIYKLEDVLKSVPIDVSFLNFIPYVAIAFGAIVFLIAFSGCCGAATESKCLLITYAVFMALLAAAKIGLTIWLFKNIDNYKSLVESNLDKAFDDPDFNTMFHALETGLQCCGTHGPDSYVNEYDMAAPTCCEDTAQDVCYKKDAYPTGCTDIVGGYIETYAKSIGKGLIAVIIVEVVAMIFAIFIIRTIKPKLY